MQHNQTQNKHKEQKTQHKTERTEHKHINNHTTKTTDQQQPKKHRSVTQH